MKILFVLMFLYGQFAWPQDTTGTAIVVIRTENEITVAADSRGVVPLTGTFSDTECKIATFGNQFAFSVAGFHSHGDWNATEIARDIWKSHYTISAKADSLVDSVTNDWIAAMEKLYSSREVLKFQRQFMPETDVLAQAAFLATDKSGTLFAEGAIITFDANVFDLTHIPSIAHRKITIPANQQLSMGHDEIIKEFLSVTTDRAKEYQKWFSPKVAALDERQSAAVLAQKLIELSILLHPKNAQLGFPIDILQIDPGSGIRWVENQKGCR